MGIESRDWNRDEAPPRSRRRASSVGAVAGAVVLITAVLGAVLAFDLPRSSDRLGIEPIPGVTLASVPDRPLYAKGDPWLSYLADEQTCPGGEDPDQPPRAQIETMVCLINYARARANVRPLTMSAILANAAFRKGREIVQCETFAHSPCGDAADAGVRALGYDGSFGENLYIADGRYGAPRVALDGWLNSPGHRENLFRSEWRVQALYVAKLEQFREYHGATLWVSNFGDR